MNGDPTAKAVKAPRARSSAPKTKTGCRDCKFRRIKCDETRPACLKCVKSGRECKGYPASGKTGGATIAIAPRPPIFAASSITTSIPKTSPIYLDKKRKSKSRITPPPSPGSRSATVTSSKTQSVVSTPPIASPTLHRPGGFAFNAQEGQYFQIFRTRTASELSGFFDSEFWTRSVLQESHSEAAIRHAVVALGALYKTLEKALESPPGSPESNASIDTAPSHYNFAQLQYAKAVTRLREALQNNETRSQRTVLISIVLFTCFQSFTGDHKSAIVQIQSGLRMLEERRQESRKPFMQREEDVVEDELVQMFTRLAVQAKSYDMAFHFPPPYVIQLSPKPKATSPHSTPSPPDSSSTAPNVSQLPTIFASSQEARAALDSLTERMMQFQEALSSFHHGPNNILPASIKSQGAGFGLQIKQWAAAFEPLLQGRRNIGVTSTERAGINVLKMSQLNVQMLFLMGYSTSEMDFDGFMSPFALIVELAKEIVVDEELTLASARCGDASNCRHKQMQKIQAMERRFPGIATHTPMGRMEDDSYLHVKASFALDLGIVPPLFVVATKCRDRRLRREAIRLLLSTPKREGMWDSMLCGKVAQWIMEVEEDGMSQFEIWDPVGMNEVVPDEKRVMVKEILFDLQKREATLRCGTRGAREGEWDPRAKETGLYW